MSRLYRSVMQDMEYYGKSYDEVMDDRAAAADSENDRRKDDALCEAYEREVLTASWLHRRRTGTR